MQSIVASLKDNSERVKALHNLRIQLRLIDRSIRMCEQLARVERMGKGAATHILFEPLGLSNQQTRPGTRRRLTSFSGALRRSTERGRQPCLAGGRAHSGPRE